jgi:hypothetical protein
MLESKECQADRMPCIDIEARVGLQRDLILNGRRYGLPPEVLYMFRGHYRFAT